MLNKIQIRAMHPNDQNRLCLKYILKALRIADGSMPRSALAKKLDVVQGYITAIESETTPLKAPSMNLLNRYADAFGVKTSDILRAAENMPEPDWQVALHEALNMLQSRTETTQN